ncbi:hypothetical protein J3Q64DRAFT_1704678 [Phycomyces blakesleeanus]|uniref:Uncharacterized protein n=2 Tax=Phycomyces blakesleeanus TaxID=4837 RepID=A0A167Q4L6_PHYB8|nr:hypothetical protein PHYBLDRAFT_164146 [Phycomyces blakesleeanus NRRL 1555(-)]OAD79064.1 hypothetical protein PHYBLDRAFT_164146 [Phycomyces blakesleeanus NRRL 1555(-)]|eukprot:XP_018297104.1 hypothetical protein PHYBLDRAFT_164146 [Phycomyces blakesleeanus NRRL 1555(-)]
MFNFNKTKQSTILPCNSDFMETFEGNTDNHDLNYRPIQTRPVKESCSALVEKPVYMEGVSTQDKVLDPEDLIMLGDKPKEKCCYQSYMEEETLLVLKKYFVDEITMAEAGKSVDMPRSTAGWVIRRIRSRLNLPARRSRMHKYACLEEYEKTLCKYVKTMLLQKKL